MNSQVDQLWADYPNLPMKVLWRVLQLTGGTEVDDAALGVITDPRCGIERRSTPHDGPMHADSSKLSCSDGGATPLMLAVLSRRVKVLKALLELGADLTAYKCEEASESPNSAIHMAILTKNIDAMALLVSFGASVNDDEQSLYTPLCLCLRSFYVTSAPTLLMDNGADVSLSCGDEGYSPMHWAALSDNAIAMPTLISNGADLHACFCMDRLTPLNLCVSNRLLETSRLLINNGANVNTRGTSGGGVIHDAAFDGMDYLVRLLLENGADVGTLNDAMETPLHEAANGATLSVIKLLLDCGADPVASNSSGLKPYHKAIDVGSIREILLLLAEADIDGSRFDFDESDSDSYGDDDADYSDDEDHNADFRDDDDDED